MEAPSPSTILANLLKAGGIPLSVFSTTDGPPVIYTLTSEATPEHHAIATASLAALPEAVAVVNARVAAFNQAESQGITVPGIASPLAATPTDWQYYTNLVAVCVARQLQAIRARAETVLQDLQAIESPSNAELKASIEQLCSAITNPHAGAYERPCAIATKGAPHVYPTNQDAIDGGLNYADQAQTPWEATL